LSILFALTGCVSRVADERAVEAERVLRDLERLGEEQGQWLLAVNASREHVERVLAEKRTQAEISLRESGDPILARMEVITMVRDPLAPFRYRGRVRLQQPAAFEGREVDGLLLSHERDLTGLSGQTIEVATHSKLLERQLEPMGPFSINGQSTFAADDRDGRFRQFDEQRQNQALALTGRITAFAADPENRIGHFMFDILFSGDVATVVIEMPARYRGTKLRVLVEHDQEKRSERWREVGVTVTFSTAETTVAWEPWGFTRAAELKNVMFPGMAGDGSGGGTR
jgi:hypothetical protein